MPTDHTDLRTASAADLISWLRSLPVDDQGDPPATTKMLLIADAVGLTDLTALADHLDVLAGDELAVLTKDGTVGVEPALDFADISRIGKVGATAYLLDRDNVDDWASVADAIADADTSDWRPRIGYADRWNDYGRHTQTRKFIAALLHAGRGPRYATELVNRAVEHNMSPDTYGFGATITPAVFADLAAAGVGGAELDAMLREGISRDAAIALIADSCPAGAVIAAKRSGIPEERWRETTTGMNPNWFPLFDTSEDRPMDPIGQGAIGRLGFTWEQLRTLADNGWGDVATYNMNSVRFGSGRRSGGNVVLAPADAVTLAESGITPDVLSRWATALTASSKRDYRSRAEAANFSRPLLGRGQFRFAEDLDAVRKLRDARISPSTLNDYRYAGCTSVDDVITASQAGITPSRVKYLRESYGRTLDRFDKRKFLANLRELMQVHEDDLARAATAQADAGSGDANSAAGART